MKKEEVATKILSLFENYFKNLSSEQKLNLKEDIYSVLEESISRGKFQKKGMNEKASTGSLMSRTPFGYKLLDGKLVPAENFREVEQIFQLFLDGLSLNQIAKKYNLSVNGVKKVLKNFTYIGKIKFDNQVFEGKHQPIVSSTLFNHVQNKLENKK
jgi:DNA invertase Pin-like site-specific DNA recombinase